jgi:3-hydroxyisobutyrate dehydrogenase-like beta-hydroxyacid dehydrogenase
MEELGFIGTGNLGGTIASLLIGKGYPLTVFDIDKRATAALREQGATVVESPREVADAAATVFACLPSPDISRDVALGKGGVWEGKSVQLYVEMSTLGVPVAEEIADGLKQKNVTMLDTPISNGAAGLQSVRAGDFAIMCAGQPDAYARAQPIFMALSRSVFYVGERPGMAQVCKVVNNAIAIAGLTMACEAIVMGVKAGVDPKMLLDIVNAGSGRNSATADKFPRTILPRKFDNGGRLEIGLKDMKLYLETVHGLGLPAPVGSAVFEIWQAMGANGGDQRGYTRIIEYFERWADIEVKD